MLFSEIMQAIHPHLMKDADVPKFTRNIIQMLCDIPEQDWYTKKDPSSDSSYKDSSLRKFYTRGITKKLAKSMLGRLTRDQFIEAIEDPDRNDAVLEGLIEDIKPFLDDDLTKKINVTNVGEVLFDLFQKALESCINPDLDNDRKFTKANRISGSLKPKFGATLINDCKETCSNPGCHKSLVVYNNKGIGEFDYEVLLIEPDKNQTYQNMLAVCHNCFANYVYNHQKKDEKELLSIKKIQTTAQLGRRITDETEIEKSILLVVERLTQAKPEDYLELNFDPVSVSDKIDEKENDLLVSQVRLYVSKYYKFIENVMRDLAKQNKYQDDLIRAQIKKIYIDLERKGATPNQVFTALTERISRMTKQEQTFCGVVVSYFIQSCEVFHAPSK